MKANTQIRKGDKLLRWREVGQRLPVDDRAIRRQAHREEI